MEDKTRESRPAYIWPFSFTSRPFLLLLFVYFGMPIFILFGLAGPGYIQCLMYSRIFDEIEHTDNRKSARKERMEEEDASWTEEGKDAAWTLEGEETLSEERRSGTEM